MDTKTKPTTGGWRNAVAALFRPSTRYSVGVLTLGGAVAGILFWGGFNWAMEVSSSEAFCISCHEMRSTVYEELKKTVHYSNRSGVRATCPDCHVPKEWTRKVERKIRATFNELPLHLMGAMDTPEKFEARRRTLAERVWDDMRSSNSLECRNCHSYHTMNFEKQTPRAREKMQEAMKKGEACIECHKGIAHKLPPRDD